MATTRRSSVLVWMGAIAAVALQLAACSSPSLRDGNDDDDEESKKESVEEEEKSGSSSSGPSSSSSSSSSSTSSGPAPGPACGGWTIDDPGCQTCFESQCCSQGSACYENVECRSLLECVLACTSDACVQGCASAHPGGLSDLDALSTCVFDTACASACSPPTKGVGDTCSSNGECISGLCNGSWCTEPCWKGNSLCAATSQSLENENGEFNWCVETASSETFCFPGCSYDSDCAPYGAGAHCLWVYDVDGYEVGVCSF